MELTDKQMKSLIEILVTIDRLELLSEARKKIESGQSADIEIALIISEVNKIRMSKG